MRVCVIEILTVTVREVLRYGATDSDSACGVA